MSNPSGFVWYELVTNGVDAAAEFYGKVVGWDVRDSEMPGTKYLLFGKNGQDVGGMMDWTMAGTTGHPEWMAHIYTPEVDAEVERVMKDGGKVVRPATDIPHVGRFAVMLDPQGAKFLLFQPSQNFAPPRLQPNEPGAVGWNELTTTDWQASWDFYSKHYGWTKGMAVDMGPMGTYQTFMTSEGGSGGGMMNVPEAFKANFPGPFWLFYFTVEDIKAAAARIQENGGTVTHGPSEVPGGAWIVQATDPQGGRFAVTAAK